MRSHQSPFLACFPNHLFYISRPQQLIAHRDQRYNHYNDNTIPLQPTPRAGTSPHHAPTHTSLNAPKPLNSIHFLDITHFLFTNPLSFLSQVSSSHFIFKPDTNSSHHIKETLVFWQQSQYLHCLNFLVVNLPD